MDESRPTKKMKIRDGSVDATNIRAKRSTFLNSLSRRISPPPGQTQVPPSESSYDIEPDTESRELEFQEAVGKDRAKDYKHLQRPPKSSSWEHETGLTTEPKASYDSDFLPSPVQLSQIRDLQASQNVDTVSIHDILGHPLIKEAWIFNYCFDVEWLMNHFDPDIRDLVQVKIVHGSWRKEDQLRIAIDEACNKRSNVQAIQAYLPDAFGTHHSKMFVLFRHDDYAQVVIHTANMLPKDWTNMTQAIWRSPLLPTYSGREKQAGDSGFGAQFQQDLVRYLKAYGNRLKDLTQQLQLYDFAEVKAAIVASVPSKFKISATDAEVWGHEMLRRKLLSLRSVQAEAALTPHFVFQVSSIATLPAKWLEETLFLACGSEKENTSIIFPTAIDVAQSLDGYSAGGSIHTKAQTPAHLKQISSMRPHLCRWTAGPVTSNRSGRDLAAPHIKTYIRFSSKATQDNPSPYIDWALVTSANLSTQAWGSTPKISKGQKSAQEQTVHIQSYEIGILCWPEIFDTNGERGGASSKTISIKMVPTFKKDRPVVQQLGEEKLIGFRMPYDLPLTSYAAEELPWSPRSDYHIPDRHGRTWQ